MVDTTAGDPAGDGTGLRPTKASLAEQNRGLRQRVRELQTFAEIASTMQTTMDVTDVQERVVHGLTDRLGFRRAVVGVCDAGERYVTGWLAATQGGGAASVDHLMTVDLGAGGDPLVDALTAEHVSLLAASALGTAADRSLVDFFGASAHECVAVAPIRCRGHIVGGLLVDISSAQVDQDVWALLERLATQAGLALANVRLCVERTQKLTQDQERMRIASELHDVIAHALFGIAYQLRGSADELSEGPLRIRLEGLAATAHETLQQVRRAIFDIWPDELTTHMLERELAGIADELAAGLPVRVRISPEFDSLDSELRKTAFRICQEAVTNVARHARANRAEVAIQVRSSEVIIRVSDDGVGVGAERPDDPERMGFGLRCMAERAEALGGELSISPAAGGGTCVIARLPRIACRV